VGQDDAGRPIKRQVSDKVRARAKTKLDRLIDELDTA
jgi:hypothetical protein